MAVEFVQQTNGTWAQEETGVVASLTKKQLDLLVSLASEIEDLRGQIDYARDVIGEIEISGTVGYGFDVSGGEEAMGEVSAAEDQVLSIHGELKDLLLEIGAEVL